MHSPSTFLLIWIKYCGCNSGKISKSTWRGFYGAKSSQCSMNGHTAYWNRGLLCTQRKGTLVHCRNIFYRKIRIVGQNARLIDRIINENGHYLMNFIGFLWRSCQHIPFYGVASHHKNGLSQASFEQFVWTEIKNRISRDWMVGLKNVFRWKFANNFLHRTVYQVPGVRNNLKILLPFRAKMDDSFLSSFCSLAVPQSFDIFFLNGHAYIHTETLIPWWGPMAYKYTNGQISRRKIGLWCGCLKFSFDIELGIGGFA